MSKPKKSESWSEKVKKEESLFDVDTLTLLNTAANGIINDDRAQVLNEKLLQFLKDNKHEDLNFKLQSYTPEQKLRLLTLKNDFLFKTSIENAEVRSLNFFEKQIGAEKLTQMIQKENYQVIYNFLSGEWFRNKKNQILSSENCVQCFNFFLKFISEEDIKRKIDSSELIKLESVEDSFHTAVAQFKEEGPLAKRLREKSSKSLNFIS